MAVVVQLEKLTGYRDSTSASDDTLIELTDNPGVLGRLWGAVLMMAVRDEATSVHYHPWRKDGGLAYVVDDIRYVMVPPPAELSGAVVAVARSLFTPAEQGGLLARLGRGRRAAPVCSPVELDVWGNVHLWDAVVWSSGERAGVELFRVAPAVPSATGQH